MAFAQPDSESEFVLDTNASAVAISGILHQWQGPPRERRLRPIVYGSKKLTATQAKYRAPKLEMYAAYHFIVKNHSYVCPRKFTLRVDNQALSWLKRYSTDKHSLVDGSWHWKSTISILNIDPERNIADGLSNRTNHYRRREQQHEKLPPVAQRWNFLSQDEYERPPTVPWFDIQGRVIPNHPELPVHLKNLQPKPPDLVQRVIRRTKRAKQRAKQKESLQVPPSHNHHLSYTPTRTFFPNYPEDWIDVTEEARYDYLVPTHATNVASRTTYDLANAEGAALQNAPAHIKQQYSTFTL